MKTKTQPKMSVCRNPACPRENRLYDAAKSRSDYTGYCGQCCMLANAKRLGWRRGKENPKDPSTFPYAFLKRANAIGDVPALTPKPVEPCNSAPSAAPAKPELQPALPLVPERKLANQTSDQDILEHMVNKPGGRAESMSTVNAVLRVGAYFEVTAEGRTRRFYVGLGRNDPNGEWRVVAQKVD